MLTIDIVNNVLTQNAHTVGVSYSSQHKGSDNCRKLYLKSINETLIFASEYNSSSNTL